MTSHTLDDPVNTVHVRVLEVVAGLGTRNHRRVLLPHSERRTPRVLHRCRCWYSRSSSGTILPHASGSFWHSAAVCSPCCHAKSPPKEKPARRRPHLRLPPKSHHQPTPALQQAHRPTERYAAVVYLPCRPRTSIHNPGAMLPFTVAGRFRLLLAVGISAPAVVRPRLGTDPFCTPPPSTKEPPSDEGNLNQLRCHAPTHGRRALHQALLGSRHRCVLGR